MPPINGGIFYQQLLVAVFALLVGDAAAGLASGLARSLALTAAAVLGAVAEVASFDGNDMLHDGYLHKFNRIHISIFFSNSQFPRGALQKKR